jgi:hypothetical protein
MCRVCRVGVGFLACFSQNSKKNAYSPFKILLHILRKDERMKGPEGFMKDRDGFVKDYDGFLACFGPFFAKTHTALSNFLPMPLPLSLNSITRVSKSL